MTKRRFEAVLGMALLFAGARPARAELPEYHGSPDGPGPVGTVVYRGLTFEYRVVDGIAVAEGDILLGPPEDLVSGGASGSLAPRAIGITNTSYRWPGGVVPYTIDPNIPNQQRITDAVNHWNTLLAGYITIVPRTTESVYLNFTGAGTSSCSSYVGRLGIAAQPVTIGDSCSTGNTIHEIGHSLGLFHEHTRNDRDAYITVQTANIQTSALGNFTKATTGTDIGAYDYGSIMHYSATAFSSNGQPTIVTIPPGISIGQRTALSAGDVAGIQTMYGASPDITPPALSNGSPTGTLAAGTSQATLSLSTNESATCKYGTIANTAYASIANTFSATGGTAHSVLVTGLQNGGSYSYYVRCRDAALNANSSDYAVTFGVAAAADVTPPAVALTSPADGATVSGTVNLIANATDNVGVAKVWFMTDGVVRSTDTTAPYSFSWNTTAAGNGAHAASARAFDAAGNSAVDAVTLNVSNGASPPDQGDISPPEKPRGMRIR